MACSHLDEEGRTRERCPKSPRRRVRPLVVETKAVGCSMRMLASAERSRVRVPSTEAQRHSARTDSLSGRLTAVGKFTMVTSDLSGSQNSDPG